MTKMGVTTEDLVAHLEIKIHNDEFTNAEYGLYIDYKNLGEGVFKYDENKYIVAKLKMEVKHEWGL